MNSKQLEKEIIKAVNMEINRADEINIDGNDCEFTVSEKSPDITLSTSDVAAAYLGGVRFSLLARSGRIDEDTAGSVELLDKLFSTDRMPWCIDGW